MQDIGKYILSVGMAALVVALITEFSDKKSSSGILIRMVCGLFLTFTVINPLTEMNFEILETFSGSYSHDAEAAVTMGTEKAEDSLREIIKQETETYILDKAQSYGCTVEVEVAVGKGTVPKPESVTISGQISTDARKALEEMLETELGISKEYQQWSG